VTPYELEVALQAEQSWTGRYVLDFEKLLAEHDGARLEGKFCKSRNIISTC